MAISAYSNNIGSNYTAYDTHRDNNRIAESLASGKQINRSADNPAGMAIVNAMTSDIRAMNTGSQNTLMGVAVMQTADGAASNMNDNLMRMRELTLQSINGTINDSQRAMLDQEFQQLYQGMNQISQNTQFNGQNILNGDITSMNIQVGESSTALNLPALTGDSLSLNSLSIGNLSGANSAMAALDQAIQMVGDTRAQYGSQQNGLMSAYENRQIQNTNTQASRSQINETNYAQAVAEQNRQAILNQSQMAMMAQGNQNRSAVLQLLF